MIVLINHAKPKPFLMLILSEAVNLRWDFLRKRKRKRNSLEFLSPTGTQEFLGKGRGQMLEKFLQEPRNALINSFKVPLHDSELIHFPQNFEYVTLHSATCMQDWFNGRKNSTSIT